MQIYWNRGNVYVVFVGLVWTPTWPPLTSCKKQARAWEVRESHIHGMMSYLTFGAAFDWHFFESVQNGWHWGNRYQRTLGRSHYCWRDKSSLRSVSIHKSINSFLALNAPILPVYETQNVSFTSVLSFPNKSNSIPYKSDVDSIQTEVDSTQLRLNWER